MWSTWDHFWCIVCAYLLRYVQFSSVAQSCQLFAIPWTEACQTSLSITNSWSLPRLMSIESVMPSNHLILCHPLLLLPSVFTSSRVFSFASGGQSTGVSASTSVLTMNSQDLLKDGLVGSPCNPRDSQESSTSQFKGINSLALSLSYFPALRSVREKP